MSKIALAGNASGTGTITLESPNTNSNFTITLPAASGTLVTTGGSGSITVGAGTAAAPSISCVTDSNTGIFFPAADNIAFSEGGVEAFRIQNDGSGIFQGTVAIGGAAIIGGNLRANGSGDSIYAFVAGTAQTASGTALEFTGIPSWVKRINVILRRVSTNGTSLMQIQIGSGGYTTSGYVGAASGITSTVATVNYSTGALLQNNNTSSITVSGTIRIENIAENNWVFNGVLGRSDAAGTHVTGGSLDLSGTLDRVRLTTVNGTDQFDAGTVNITYE